ncbi:MAG: hypothetical protein EXR53_01255 [Dehalococcoidia bacterium]|nr:hypothetical protein [Dehalococcoidia bacterium]
MDFNMTPPTTEMEQFRQEVRTWLEENIDERMKEPVDEDDFTGEMYSYWREKHQQLAKKGWLNPTYPKEYGGGGLTGAHEAVIVQELREARACSNMSDRRTPESIMVWGSEEQKQKFLVPILTAKVTTWQKLTEPHSGSDLASYESKAVRDGDDWILNGSNVFISGRGARPDYLCGPMQTDRDAPRHRNLGYFLIPADQPGVEIRPMNLVVGNTHSHTIFLTNVRVPGNHLIGGDHQGWQVLSTQLEQEHGGDGGGGGSLAPNRSVESLITYARETKVNGRSLGSYPLAGQSTTEAYIDGHVDKLFSQRAYWIHQSGSEPAHEGALSHLFDKLYGIRHEARFREVMGPYSLLGTTDPLAPHGGLQEIRMRNALAISHRAGSLNIAKVVLARRMGVSRTKERAAPMRTKGAKSAH